MAFQSYPYRGQTDTERMRDLLVSMRAGGGHGCWHVGDLVWRLFLQSLRHDLGQTFRLWDDADGSLAGFAVWTPSRSRVMQVRSSSPPFCLTSRRWPYAWTSL